jgi:hypothetical protein
MKTIPQFTRIFRAKYVFFTIVVIGLLIFCGLVYFLDNRSSQKSSQNTQTSRSPEEILPHPLNLTNAVQLVEDLRFSRPVSISPINLEYKNILISTSELCSDVPEAEPISILILIKTRASEKLLRRKVRRSLRNQTALLNNQTRIRYGFLLGYSEEGISDEIFKYKDFIIGDFRDTYQNLTYKTMMGLRWAMEECPNFQFHVSADVDMHICLEKLVRFLKDPYNYPKVKDELNLGQILSPDEQFYAGHVFPYGSSYPHRMRTSPWYLAQNQYPADLLPAYVSGRMVVMSKKTVSSFYYLSPFIQHINVDDVYLGLLANKLRIMPFNVRKLAIHAYRNSNTSVDICLKNSPKAR